MKNFLKKIKLVDTLVLELSIKKEEFKQRLEANIDVVGSNILGDLFNSTKYQYNGKVEGDSFQLKRKKKLFDTTINHAKAKGLLTEVGDKLTVDTEINGFHGQWVVIGVFILLFYPILLSFLMVQEEMLGMEKVFTLSFIVGHGFLMVGILYFMMRSSVKKMKYDLEREFFFLAR